MPALELTDVSKRFGNLEAVRRVSFSIEADERLALIGPNGAGKTTLFNLICGDLRPTEGTIRVDGRDITAASPERVAGAGLGRTFQRNALLGGSTVYESVRLAVQRKAGLGFRMLRSVDAYKPLRQRTDEILERIGLADRSAALPQELSYGEQRQLELGMALGGEPAILLLDEPTAGMSAAETEQMVALLKALPDDVAIIVVEHDMDVVTALARRIVVLDAGEVIADGSAEEVRSSPEVVAAYLGGVEDEEGVHA